jgi:type II secretory pathway predicted ATPase ExeA
MYEKVFQLKARPFPAAPHGDHYFPTEASEQASMLCKNCVDRQSGPALVLGVAGSGKSLLLSQLAEHYAVQFQVVSVACSRTDSRMDLMQNILFQLGQSYRGMTESEVRLELANFLKPGPHCPCGILVLLDDANCLSVTILDEFRRLSGTIQNGQVRCHLILAGNQRLEELLSEPGLESLNQRIVARCYLTALSQTETAEYIREHLRRAGGGVREFFAEDALRQIHQFTGGIPRVVNQLCDHAMIECGKTGVAPITKSLIWSCWSELQRLPNPMQSGSDSHSNLKAETNHSSMIEFGELGSSDDDQLELINFADRQCTAMPCSDLDPDAPLETNPAPNTPNRAPQTSNPFDEEFESEEVVTDPFVLTAIGHNHAAASLTRYEIEHYGVDDLPTWSTPKDLLSMFHGAYPPHQTADVLPESQFTSPTVSPDSIWSSDECDINTGSIMTIDDRDVLVVSRASTRSKRIDDAIDDKKSDEHTNVSTGRAVRMDYKQLFQQLRGSGAESSTSKLTNN